MTTKEGKVPKVPNEGVADVQAASVTTAFIEYIQGVFFNWYPPKKLKYGKPRLGESTLT